MSRHLAETNKKMRASALEFRKEICTNSKPIRNAKTSITTPHRSRGEVVGHKIPFEGTSEAIKHYDEQFVKKLIELREEFRGLKRTEKAKPPIKSREGIIRERLKQLHN
jgi:hypothetical protein